MRRSIAFLISISFAFTANAQGGKMQGIDAFFMEDGFFDNVADAVEDAENAFYLDLSLQSPKLTTIPADVFKLINLKYLELGYNQIGSVDEGIVKLMKLEVLGLNGNKYLKSVYPDLSALTNLKKIYVNDTGLSAEQLTALEAVLPEGCELIK